MNFNSAKLSHLPGRASYKSRHQVPKCNVGNRLQVIKVVGQTISQPENWMLFQISNKRQQKLIFQHVINYKIIYVYSIISVILPVPRS